MYCSKYDGEYYVDECYAKIPLRWMAWEAVISVILSRVIAMIRTRKQHVQAQKELYIAYYIISVQFLVLPMYIFHIFLFL